MTQKEVLNKLWKRGCEFLGTEKAILGGAMSWISDSDLVAAISEAGGFGVLAGGALPPELLNKWIKDTQSKTKKTFGVNLITMHTALDTLIDVCANNKVSHVVFAGGLPRTESIAKAKSLGMKVMCFAPATSIGKRMIKAGAEALIIEGHEAGGHIGPVSTTILAQEILPTLSEQVPVFVAGGIGTGKMMASYLMLGASGVQIGTRFVCTHECNAHPDFKKVFIKASARDTMPTVQIDARFPVIPVRAIINDGSKKFMEIQAEVISKYKNGDIELKEGQLEIESFWMGSLRRAVVEGDIATGSLMAGQSVEFVKKEMSVKEVIDELNDDAIAELKFYDGLLAK